MQVGVRELQNQTSNILHQVTTRRTPVDVTRHGRVIARIVPVDTPLSEEELARTEQILAELKELSKQVSALWPKGVSAVDAVSEQRR